MYMSHYVKKNYHQFKNKSKSPFGVSDLLYCNAVHANNLKGAFINLGYGNYAKILQAIRISVFIYFIVMEVQIEFYFSVICQKVEYHPVVDSFKL